MMPARSTELTDRVGRHAFRTSQSLHKHRKRSLDGRWRVPRPFATGPSAVPTLPVCGRAAKPPCGSGLRVSAHHARLHARPWSPPASGMLPNMPGSTCPTRFALALLPGRAVMSRANHRAKSRSSARWVGTVFARQSRDGDCLREGRNGERKAAIRSGPGSTIRDAQ